jgi:uncharacterized protein (TIGR03437 family)
MRRTLVALVCALSCHAQTVVTGAGYSSPSPIAVAPGQVITIFAHVPDKTPAAPVVADAPLPLTLGGFSVLLRQTFPSDPTPVPILSVGDSQSCSLVAPLVCDTVSMITVEVPFELTANAPRTTIPQTTGPQNFARLEISYNGSPTNSLVLNPLPDSIHILNACDVAATANASPGIACLPLVARPDGSLVSSGNPAMAGELLTISVVGMGLADTPVATGTAAPQQAPSVDGVLVALDMRVNGAAGMPPAESSSPASAQLQPGAVGIYTVTVTVPSSSTPACSSSVRSNLTINITRNASYDGVGICVVPSPASQTSRGRLVVE